MSDPDRGAYTPPTDEPLAFDARTPQTRRPMPLTLIASGAVLVVLIAAVFLFYRSGVRGANEPPRAVGEPIEQMKIQPAEEAKPIDEAVALDVYVEDAAQDPAAAAPTFAPAPEEPQPRPAAQPLAQPAQPATRVAEAALPPAKTPPLVQTPAQTAPPAAKAPTAQAALRQAQPVPVPAPAKAATPPARAESAPAAVASAGGAAAVQIGAFSSAAIADQEFAKVKAAFGKYTAGKAKRVEPVERSGSTLYRTAFTGFSKADAQAFCAALKAAGRACLVK